MRSLIGVSKENRVGAPGPFRNRPERNGEPGGGSSGGETTGGRAGRRIGIRLSDRIINGILVLALTIGICMLLYPTVSNYWNSFHQTQLIEKYSQEVSSIDAEEYERILDEARRYNAQIAEKGIDWRLTDEKRAVYERTLNPFGNGMMGYIKIPKIGVELPIFHGTKGMTMETAVGHMEQSSLPIGGAGSHCMLAGHRGLMSVMIFTHLDELQEGDTFTLRVLNETMTYEVDQIRAVLPNDVSNLIIVPGQDLCTLITCTPYGINTHRLLVRGHRIGTVIDPMSYYVNGAFPADAVQIQPMYVAPFIGVPFLIILLVLGEIRRRRLKKRQDDM